MKKLLSLPSNLVDYFHQLKAADPEEWFCAADPKDSKLGSGGGTIWLLDQCQTHFAPDKDRQKWLAEEKRIILHAGGQSRRLPAYAPSGKILTPIPVFRWKTGQCLNQDLLSLQVPLYEKILEAAPPSIHTLVASGDVYIRNNEELPPIPEADVICYGIWADPSIATHHGVFISKRKSPEVLDYMLQKPSLQELAKLSQTHLFLMDIGVWLLSDRAVELLRKRSEATNEGENTYQFYNLYTDFGLALGKHPCKKDEELNELKIAILPLPSGEFYHYGTSPELISSTVSIQNLVYDQRRIVQYLIKPHPSMFVQNVDISIELTEKNADLWVENCYLGKKWKIHHQHIFTGIPFNNWSLEVPPGICVDIVPIGEEAYVIRPYGFYDLFNGKLESSSTHYLNIPFKKWMRERGVNLRESNLDANSDIQEAPIFPLCNSIEKAGKILNWMISGTPNSPGKELWLESKRLSANDIMEQANLKRLFEQRKSLQNKNWLALAKNYQKSIFYQLNLGDAAENFVKYQLPLPPSLPPETPSMIQIRDHMFRAKVYQLSGQEYQSEEQKAFSLLREDMIENIKEQKLHPQRHVLSDQIVWGRSPVRIDLAGGWTDTPPYCQNEGGRVVNIAVELNGQPPIQVYIKPTVKNEIILRSIDLGASETIRTYKELSEYDKEDSSFSIPKAALTLAGFSPEFSDIPYPTLQHQLKEIGGGLEITLLSAIPAGSGLGTSSVLAATVLGCLSDFFGMGWDKNEICYRTLILEQLLTSGGGWQDQYGGILLGAKLLETERGFQQTPVIKWLPDHLFTEPEYKACHLLYYTGITRTAKTILAGIVKNMFLNDTKHLQQLKEMKQHAWNMYEAIQKGRLEQMGRLVLKSWEQNKNLDAGTNPEPIEAIIQLIQDYTLGYKLPGAGGGGYLYMIAKDPQAAGKIRQILTANPPNERARFVEMSLSEKGLQVSRS